MIFTPQQIQELLELIEYHYVYFGTQFLGKDPLTPEDKKLLKKYGVDVNKLDEKSYIEQAYKFGVLSRAIGAQETKKLKYNDFKKWIRSGGYIPLTSQEKLSIQFLKQRSFQHLKKLGQIIGSDIQQILSDQENKRRQKVEKIVKKELKEGVENRKSFQEIMLNLGHKTSDWMRDWGRIVETECNTAYQEGRADDIQRHSSSSDPNVFKHVYPGACRHCIQSYLTNGIGSQPVIYKLSQLRGNGTNIGRKQQDWKPVVESHHPWCYDKETEVLTNQGWKFFKDLSKIEQFLSVNLENGNAEWVRAVNWINYKYKGQLHYLHNKNFDLVVTGDHRHVIKTYSKKQLRLVATDKLSIASSLLKHIPNYKGKEINQFFFDNYSFDVKDFCEFMGYFISEGSLITYGSEIRIHIAQQKQNIYEKIYNICYRLFKKGIKCKGYIQVNLSVNDKELFQYLNLGKSYQKYIPDNIKELSKEYLKIFLQAFCDGDGTIYKGRKWDNYQCNDYRIFYTSSDKLASDLGELILKIGKVPSYKIDEIKEVYDKKQDKSYKQNHINWRVSETSSKFAQLSALKKELIDYDDFVYDVELEKYHTLIVRRNGRVCVSGNCRCELDEVPEGYIWDQEKQMFVPPKNYIRKIERKSKVYITIGDVEYVV